MNKIKLKLNRSLNGISAGTEIKINASRSGIPIDIFWRKRLRDSKRDNCVEVVKESESQSEVTKPKSSKE